MRKLLGSLRARCLFFLLAACLLPPGPIAPLHAGQPPEAPMPRIETGMHTAVINRIGVDAANRYLVTASDDKTLRVWELATGGLLKTLRVPIGEGNEGRLYAVAISPDGDTVAGAGWTGWDWDGKTSIYLFDRTSGRLVRRLTGLPEVIIHLAYSRDGRHLVATLGRAHGIRIFRTSDYRMVAEDSDYSAGSYWADFDPDGRLVTVSLDGFVRLYDRNFTLLAKQKAPGGNRPFSASFSPDGSKIAVGFFDSTKVDVLSGRALRLLYSPDTRGVNRNLARVAWSGDGRFL